MNGRQDMAYIIMEASAKMPSSCKGHYVRIGVVELDDGFEGTPKMLSERAKGVARIVETWESVHKGKGIRDAYSVAIKEARALLDSLSQ
jgi:hypothetical protein